MIEANRLVETASREPLGISFTLLTISSPSPGPTSRAKHVAEALAGALQPRRHDSRRDHRGLEQAQVVLGEIEHLGQVVTSALLFKSTLTSRRTGRSITRR